ncbi:alpha/beta fold hydrolase [Sabulicella glaciei]|uniref:Lysophospholipase n=1 Tax=Sabulicella glaciei TaxID=2984948 RepID=A0ABT3NXI6_9PROT|nr:alpha/beta fold hydrolase [Roseococcus sp. MDT2-1-1]MCW8086840.1 lysophospholipase [Roseococcus sp. MDT2-1-1]
MPARLSLLALLPALAGCAPLTLPAGPAVREAAIEAPFSGPALPWMPRPAYALAPPPPAPRPSGPAPEAALVMADGTQLPLRAWRPDGPPRFVVLGLHGLADHGGNFLADSGPLLARGGALVYAYDQRGFGWTPSRGIWPGTATLVEDARTVARLLAARHPGVPLFLLGESMGAAVSILADPPEASGLLLAAPAIWSRRDMSPLVRGTLAVASRLVPAVAGGASFGGIMPSDNREAMLRMARDPLVLREVRVDMAKGLVDLMDEAVAALPHCCGDKPTLFLLGARDAVVPTHISHRVLRRLDAPRIAHYPDGWHLLLRDQGRERVVADLLAFMADPRSPLPAEAAGQGWLAGPEP